MNATTESIVPIPILGLAVLALMGIQFIFNRYVRKYVHLTRAQFDTTMMCTVYIGVILTRDVPATYSTSYILVPYMMIILIACFVILLGFMNKMDPNRLIIATMSMVSVSVLSTIVHIMHAIHYDMNVWIDVDAMSTHGVMRISAPWFFTTISFSMMLITLYNAARDSKSIKIE